MPKQPDTKGAKRQRIRVAEVLVALGILGALLMPMLERKGEQPKGGAVTASERPAPIDEGPNAVELPGEPTDFDDDRGAADAPSLAASLRVLVFIITAIVVTSLIGRELLRRRRR